MKRIALTLAVVALVAGACGQTTTHGASHGNATTTTSRATGSGSSTTVAGQAKTGFVAPEVKFGTGQIGPASPTTSVPAEVVGGRPIDPTNDAGQEVIIDSNGYMLPEWLVADYKLPITWTNLSGVAQQVIFDDAPVHSPIIPPGGTFTWTSPGLAISLTYHTATGRHARLTLQNPNSP